MRIDMHCHTKEGSIDARLKIKDYISALQTKGINGMLVTDHNSYHGFHHYKHIKKYLPANSRFVVLRGIEYDTRNGGHIIVIMPDKTDKFVLLRLALRGMSVRKLVEFVHEHNGILGPAHPYDTGFYAYMNTNFAKRNPDFINEFDFIESYNSCARPDSNISAKMLARSLNKPETAGSDTHRLEVAGSSYTTFKRDIRCNNDLIAALKSDDYPIIEEENFESTYWQPNVIIEKLGIIGYWLYNKVTTAKRLFHRAK